MGEQLILVGIKLSAERVARLDREVLLWNPFVTKRGAMGRALIEIALDAIDAGILDRKPQPLQGYLQKSSAPPEMKVNERQLRWKGIAPSKRQAEQCVAELLDEIAKAERKHRPRDVA